MLFSFFFQAEDGIRDTSVTGVQTCALPILRCADTTCTATVTDTASIGATQPTGTVTFTPGSSCSLGNPSGSRSEERRVGKEGRYRCCPFYLKKKNNMEKSALSL